MEREIQQLVEMGATVPQARAALRQYKDVMQAAERIFEGQFDNIAEEDEDMGSNMELDTYASSRKKVMRVVTPDQDEDDDEAEQDEGDDDDFVDYDSDYETKTDQERSVVDVDPYSGIFFSKDRREEVIEVEEEPEVDFIPETRERVTLMTQGQWMKGCPEGEYCCPHDCGASVTRRKSDFFAIYSDFTAYIEHLRKIVPYRCPRCQLMSCFACGETISQDNVRRPKAVSGDDPLFHCSNLQGVILGAGLSMLEQMFTEQTRNIVSEQDSKARTSKRRKTNLSTSHSASPGGDDDDDVYYAGIVQGKKAKGGTGYAGDQKEDTSGQIEAQAIQKVKDEKIGQLLSKIRVYIPSLHRPGGARTSDYLVHPTALAHLRRRFNYVCSSLLRNDSLADMSDRSVLYFELLEWLETISNHEALASMMAMPIMVISSVKTVTTKRTSVKQDSRIRERTIVYEGSSGPRELLEAIAIQARAALKSLEGTKHVEPDPEEMTEDQKRMTNDTKGKAKEPPSPVSDDSQKLLTFCRRILATANAIDRSLRDTKGDAFVDRLHASLPKILTSSSFIAPVDPGTTEESARKAYIEWATKVRFEYCDLTFPVENTVNTGKDEDLVPHYKFYYNSEARMLANSDFPKRSLAIAKELAILTTNLPVAWDSSIFLRVDETRVDVIKALITGPEGTPYQNGCYLFDIFLGPSYNQSPPSVKYMTTNGGKYRFNPNLYADGKVCLSLLGTWSGPGWLPGKSTLLQVLISIQSMILCEEPYLNEPGWASSGGTPQSQAYSANVRRMVVRTAILGNLINPPEPFDDIIRTHFRLKARSISSQLDRWVAQDDGKPITGDGGSYMGRSPTEAGSSTNGFLNDVNTLKKMLTQIQDGEE